MTDGQLVKVIARIQRLNDNMVDLLSNVVIDHPNGEALRKALCEEGMGIRWNMLSLTHPHLEHPERWECEHNKLVYKGVFDD